MIVIGTHGRKGTARLFLGSVAERVVKSAACPVLVARQETPEMERWEGRGALCVVVGTDGSPSGKAAFSWVGAFAKGLACDVSAVRVYSPLEEAVRYGLDDSWEEPQHHPEQRRLLQRNLHRDARAFMGQEPARLRMRAATRDAAEVLTEEAGARGLTRSWWCATTGTRLWPTVLAKHRPSPPLRSPLRRGRSVAGLPHRRT